MLASFYIDTIYTNIGLVNVQSCVFIIFQYQPISLQHSLLTVEKPIIFWLSVVQASNGIFNKWEDNSNVNMSHWTLTCPTQQYYWSTYLQIKCIMMVPEKFRCICRSRSVVCQQQYLYLIWSPTRKHFNLPWNSQAPSNLCVFILIITEYC